MRPKLNVRVDPGLLERIDRLASAEGKYRSLLVQALLNDAMDMREFGGSFNVPSDSDRKRFGEAQPADPTPVTYDQVEHAPMPKTAEQRTYDSNATGPLPSDKHPEVAKATLQGPGGKPHRHTYGPEAFVAEARPDRGVRMGTYKCSCGRVTKQPLDEWNRASEDMEKKR